MFKKHPSMERAAAQAEAVSRTIIDQLSEDADETCIELAGALGYIGGCQLGAAAVPRGQAKSVIHSFALSRDPGDDEVPSERFATRAERVQAVITAYRAAFATGYADRIDRANGMVQR